MISSSKMIASIAVLAVATKAAADPGSASEQVSREWHVKQKDVWIRIGTPEKDEGGNVLGLDDIQDHLDFFEMSVTFYHRTLKYANNVQLDVGELYKCDHIDDSGELKDVFGHYVFIPKHDDGNDGKYFGMTPKDIFLELGMKTEVRVVSGEEFYQNRYSEKMRRDSYATELTATIMQSKKQRNKEQLERPPGRFIIQPSHVGLTDEDFIMHEGMNLNKRETSMTNEQFVKASPAMTEEQMKAQPFQIWINRLHYKREAMRTLEGDTQELMAFHYDNEQNEIEVNHEGETWTLVRVRLEGPNSEFCAAEKDSNDWIDLDKILREGQRRGRPDEGVNLNYFVDPRFMAYSTNGTMPTYYLWRKDSTTGEEFARWAKFEVHGQHRRNAVNFHQKMQAASDRIK